MTLFWRSVSSALSTTWRTRASTSEIRRRALRFPTPHGASAGMSVRCTDAGARRASLGKCWYACRRRVNTNNRRCQTEQRVRDVPQSALRALPERVVLRFDVETIFQNVQIERRQLDRAELVQRMKHLVIVSTRRTPLCISAARAARSGKCNAYWSSKSEALRIRFASPKILRVQASGVKSLKLPSRKRRCCGFCDTLLTSAVRISSERRMSSR